MRVKASGAFTDEYAIITKITDDGTDATCKVYPSFSFQQSQAASINFCFAYYPVIGRTNAAQKDLHVRFARVPLEPRQVSDSSVWLSLDWVHHL